jgi:hypothetical protein
LFLGIARSQKRPGLFPKRRKTWYLAGAVKLPPFLAQNQLIPGQRRFSLWLGVLICG